MNPTDNSLPPLPNLDLTIAPKDDLLVLPQDLTTKPSQTTPPVSNTDQISDFSPPSGWGKKTVYEPPKVGVPEYPDLYDHNQEGAGDSNLAKAVKVFLISIALVLLGVLLGVFASTYTNSSKAPYYNQESSSIEESSETVTQDTLTPSESDQTMTQPDYTKKIEYRNNGNGPYSFDLLMTDDWKIASNSTKKNDLKVVLGNRDLFVELVYNPKQDLLKPSLCLLTEEIAPKNIPYLRYGQYKELNVGDLNWRMVKDQTATESASYVVCEQNKNNQFTSLTSIGFVGFGQYSGKEIDLTTESKIAKLFSGLKVISIPTDWKKYTKNGVSFQYPPDAKTTKRDPDPLPVMVQVDNLKPRAGGGGGPEFEGWMIYISEVQPNLKNLSLLEWATENDMLVSDPKKPEDLDVTQTEPIDLTIGGSPAIMWNTSGPGGTLDLILVKRSNGVTLVTVFDNGGRDKITTDKVISSFIFSD